jgi:NAD(P)-dependent dehydrogenase (short-subunit alcohol dehydrogenase family)
MPHLLPGQGEADLKLFDLAGKSIIVTGSSRGIGRAIAEEMARAGARVVISSRKAEPCEAVASAIKRAGGEALAIPCNVGDKQQVKALIDKTRAAFGRIDCLVLNAATNPYYGPLAEIGDDAFDKIMAVNVKSQLWFCSLVLPEMAAHGDGSIILIASIGGYRGSPNLGGYAVSKAAVMQLARSLAGEWGQVQHPGQLHRARLGAHRFLQGADRQSGSPRPASCRDASGPRRRARRHRRHGGAAGLGGGALHHRPVDRHRRWRDHCRLGQKPGAASGGEPGPVVIEGERAALSGE